MIQRDPEFRSRGSTEKPCKYKDLPRRTLRDFAPYGNRPENRENAYSRSMNLLVNTHLFAVLLFQIAVQHGRCFRTARKACRIDPAAACAAHDSCFICPGKRLTRIAAYAACVREAFKRCGHSGTLAAIAAVAVQNCCELLSCNRVIRRKPSAAAAVDDVVFRCPCNSICICLLYTSDAADD